MPTARRRTIVSDDAWRVAPGPITFSCIFGGEDYDARLERPGWDQPGFNDAGWQAATVVDGPGGRLVAQSAPPIKVIETFAPKSVSEPSPGVFVYDLGQNFSGWPKLSLRGPAGAKVKIIPAEVLDEKGFADQRGSGSPCYFSYTLKGQGIETWHPQFSYYGFRYLQVEGAAPEGKAAGNTPALVKIEGQFIRSSSSRVGSFACSNDLFNRIHRLVDWGIGSNLQSILTDCPHREKLGWLEIAHLMGPSIMFNYDVAALYAKIARDTAESQLPDGMVPTTAPEYSLHPGNFRDSPEWGSAAVIIPWQLYQWYGDRRVLSECYPTMKRYVDYLTSRAQGHILAYGLGDWGDFPSVKEHMGWAQLTPISLTDTAIYYYDATILAQTAAILDKPNDAKRYAALAEEIRTAFNRAFFNPKTNWYASGTPIVPNEVRTEWNRSLFDPKTNQYTAPSQASQALPLALGIGRARAGRGRVRESCRGSRKARVRHGGRRGPSVPAPGIGRTRAKRPDLQVAQPHDHPRLRLADRTGRHLAGRGLGRTALRLDESLPDGAHSGMVPCRPARHPKRPESVAFRANRHPPANRRRPAMGTRASRLDPRHDRRRLAD